MLESLLLQNESKTLEFKENTKSLISIIKAIIAFANTSGGNIVIGVSDKEKKVVGIENALQEEERLANAIADSIRPLIIPEIQISSFRNKELLIIQVSHAVGPFYLKSSGLERGTYVRMGSTNRLADSEIIVSLQMLAKNTYFDELPCIGASFADINGELIKKYLSPLFSDITKKHYESLNIVTRKHGKLTPTNGGILLFGLNRFAWFPDASIACVCFANETREEIIDQLEIKTPLIIAHEEILAFIRRNTKMGAKFYESVREDIPQYPHKAVREAVINAIVHADYSMKGSRIQIAIFSNRLEITNPGGLPYGQTMESALSGVSKMRNRVMGRLFREIKLIEQLGTGLQRIINVYNKTNAKQPLFDEINTHFRVTLYSVGDNAPAVKHELWEQQLIEELARQKQLSTIEIAKLWKVTPRTARTRLKIMIENGIINRIATSAKDPYSVSKLNGLSETKKIKYKGCDISYYFYPDHENVGKYVARATISIHTKNTATDDYQVYPKQESFDSIQRAEIEIIKESKKQIDEKIAER